jgi:BlaI family penicillinase repressor
MNSFKPTDSELEILKILWKNGKATVREVHEKLSEQKDSGYTTTLKLMQIMLDKGLVDREKESKSHIYFAKYEENDVQSHLLNKFVDTVFSGSTSKLVLQALGNSQTTDEELKEIRDFLDNLKESED